MSASSTALSKVVTLLQGYTPSPPWDAVYGTHEKANLVVPSLSVEVEADVPLDRQSAIVSQEFVDNREVRLSIRVHTNYRLGPIDTDTATSMADAVVRWVRENIDLDDGYRVMEVVGSAYNIEHTSSGTEGAEVIINIHKVESYVQN